MKKKEIIMLNEIKSPNAGIRFLLVCASLFFLLPQHLFAEGPELYTYFRYISNTHGSPTATQGTLIFELKGADNSTGTNYQLIQEKCYLDAALRSQFVSISFSDHFYSYPNFTITEDYDAATGRIEFIYKLNSGSAPAVDDETRFVRVTIVYNLTNAYSTISLGSISDDEPESLWSDWSTTVGEYIYNRYRDDALVNIPLGSAPTVTTSRITNIQSTSFTCGGEVISGHSFDVTARGVCWSTSSNPTIEDSHTTDGSGIGTFTSSVTGLTERTTYYVRAYATSSVGTGYGSSITTISTSPGTALNFDGTNDYVSIPDNNALDFTNTGSYTIEAWIKPETFGALEGIISKYQNEGAYGYFLRLKNSANAKGLTIDGWTTDDNILTANQWYHVAAVNDGGTRHLYLNGVEQTLTSEDPCTVQPNNDPIRIGSDFGKRFFDGSIDEVRIWNMVRTEQQIRENMYKTLDNAADELVCYWQMNNGSGSTMSVSEKGFSGTLTNMDVNNSWVNSPIPVGDGTSNSQNNFSSGTTTSLGNVQLTTTDAFDNPVNLVCTEINRLPNTTSGITGDVLNNEYYVLKSYGTPGAFSVNLIFTFPEGTISEAGQTTPSIFKLYNRGNNAEGDWTLLSTASSATSTTITFNGITSFSQLIISSAPQPVVTTNDVTNIGSQTATGGGNVTDEGASTVTARGVCWRTTENPTIENSHTSDGSGIGSFTSSITGLSEGTTYYVRAYATNSYGTSYGSNVSFTTSSGNNSPGAALNFNGSGDYVQISDNNELDLTNNYTLEAWIKPESFGSEEGIISKYHVSSHDGYMLRTSNTGNYRGLGFDQMNTADNLLTANQWYHVAAVNNNGTRHLYLNGIEQTLNGTPLTVKANTDYLRIGVDYFSNARYFDGSIDEVRIWNIVRTQHEIRENMHRSLSGTENGLVCYYQFNNGSGTTLTNKAGGHTGTLINMDDANWVNSTIPFGEGTSNTQNAFTSGEATLGNVQLTTTENFDNAVDLVCTEINRSPNTTSGISGNALNKYYVLKAYGTTGTYSVNLTITLPEGSISSADQSSPSNLKLYKRDNNADGNWTLVTSASSATSTTVTFNGITSFSQFIIASENSPLPVELVSFIASISGSSVQLNWQTATEVNNYGFEVERSLPPSPPEINSGQALPKEGRVTPLPLGKEEGDGLWKKIGFVQGYGNSNSPKSYSFEDKNPPSGKLQYRLKQIDFDGKYEYSDVVEVTVAVPAKFELMQNYPNPFNPTTTISYRLQVASYTTLKIYDILGRTMATLVNEYKQAGIYNNQLSTDNLQLSSGVYFYRLEAKGENGTNYTSIKKLIVLK